MNRWICCFLCALLFLAGCSKNKESAGSGPAGSLSAGAPIPSADLSKLDPSLRKRIEDFKSAVAARGDSAEAWGKLGQAFEAGDFLHQARQCYQEAAKLDSSSGKWLYLASNLELQNEPELALQHLSRAVALLAPTNQSQRLFYGKALAERGRLDEAAAEFKQMLASEPGHAAASLELARLQLRSNNVPAAIDLLQPSLTNSYTMKPALLLLSQAMLRSGKQAEAEALAQRAEAMPKPFDWPDAILREVQSLKSDALNVKEQVNQLLIAGRFREAEALLGPLIAKDQNNPETILLLGRLRLQERRCEEAELMFIKHLQVQTNSLQGWVQLGLARFCQGRWDTAAAAFMKATELKPDFAPAQYNLGVALSRARKPAEAITAFQNAIRSQPGDAAAHAALAEEYAQLGRTTEAKEEAGLALKIDPKQSKALRLRDFLTNPK